MNNITLDDISTPKKLKQTLNKKLNNAMEFSRLSDMVDYFNSAEKEQHPEGQYIHVAGMYATDTIDLVIGTNSRWEHTPYTYTTDDAILEALKTSNLVVGHYVLYAVKGQADLKLEDYQKKTEPTLETESKKIPEAINEVLELAKQGGGGSAVQFNSLTDMIDEFNAETKPKYNAGQYIHLYVDIEHQPKTDFVINFNLKSVGTTAEKVIYTYTTDEDFYNQLKTNGHIVVGWYDITAVKVDLSDYAKKDDLSDYAKKDEVLSHIEAVEKFDQLLFFDDYKSMITTFNSDYYNTYYVGQPIRIKNGCDLVIREVLSNKIEYQYTTDEDFLEFLRIAKHGNTAQVGFYSLSLLNIDLHSYYLNTENKELPQAINEVYARVVGGAEASIEGQKLLIKVFNTNGSEIATSEVTLPSGGEAPDLSEYVKFTDVATRDKYGLSKAGAGLYNNFGTYLVYPGSDSEIENFSSFYAPITTVKVPLAVKAGLTKTNIEWTEEEKASARALLGITATKLYKYICSFSGLGESNVGFSRLDINFSFYHRIYGIGIDEEINVNEIGIATIGTINEETQVMTYQTKPCLVYSIKKLDENLYVVNTNLSNGLFDNASIMVTEV